MASRGVRESLRLLARSPALLAALAPPAAAAAAPAGQAATSLQVEVAALRRWLHTRGTPSLWQQHLRQQPAAWLRQQGAGGSAADVQRACGRRWMTDRPRGRRELYEDINKRVTDQGWYILATAVAMVGVTYAAVPLYRMFCQATGYGGTVIEGKAVEDKIRRWEENPDEAVAAAAAKRELTVFFNSDVADGMPWVFKPTQRSVKLHPGQSTLAFYTAHNKSNAAITGVSTYNVAPQQVGQYFNKIQCFCFEEQKLRPGETIDMPVFFYIDPEFATDPKMKGINTITLSYTFFKVDEEEVEEEEEAGAGAPAAISPAAALQPITVAAAAPAQ